MAGEQRNGVVVVKPLPAFVPISATCIEYHEVLMRGYFRPGDHQEFTEEITANPKHDSSGQLSESTYDRVLCFRFPAT